MKKKFVLILALALVGSMAFAAFNFSGEAEVGYKFDLANGGVSTYGYDANTSYFAMNATTDFAKVAFRLVPGDNDFHYMQAQAAISLYLDKALAAKGVDLPVSLTAYIGDASNSGFYSYTDPNSIVDDSYDGFNKNTRTNYPIGFDVGYAGYTARTMFDIVGTDVNPVFSVKGTPVDGVSFAASFLAANKYIAGSDSEVNLSATADVAALAGLDFNLKASVFTVLGMGSSVTGDPLLLAAVTGGKDAINVYAEYSLNATADNNNSVAGSRVFAGASYALTDVTLGGGLDYEFADTLLSYSVYAKSTLGGVTYKAVLGGNADGALYIKTQAYLAF
ncbi:hypothetical protein [uncultured Sphaerochaeta sp.]|uniref:hypothetical protein n=1 Tax=uncultured Sphaerochaeta sp. TaxID=886478 RepID=UPI002A0A372F|nr:hypothetical protein [uncultured Sphaerochaeta sp.]